MNNASLLGELSDKTVGELVDEDGGILPILLSLSLEDLYDDQYPLPDILGDFSDHGEDTDTDTPSDEDDEDTETDTSSDDNDEDTDTLVENNSDLHSSDT